MQKIYLCCVVCFCTIIFVMSNICALNDSQLMCDKKLCETNNIDDVISKGALVIDIKTHI